MQCLTLCLRLAELLFHVSYSCKLCKNAKDQLLFRWEYMTSKAVEKWCLYKQIECDTIDYLKSNVHAQVIDAYVDRWNVFNCIDIFIQCAQFLWFCRFARIAEQVVYLQLIDWIAIGRVYDRRETDGTIFDPNLIVTHALLCQLGKRQSRQILLQSSALRQSTKIFLLKKVHWHYWLYRRHLMMDARCHIDGVKSRAALSFNTGGNQRIA